MVTIRHTEVLSIDTKTYDKTVIAQIDCDTLDEVPMVETVSGYVLHQGSVVDVITEGLILKLAGDGKWYDPNGVMVKG